MLSESVTVESLKTFKVFDVSGWSITCSQLCAKANALSHLLTTVRGYKSIKTSRAPKRLNLIYFFPLSSLPPVQSRSLQNLQASRVMRVIDPSFPTEDESDPLNQHFPEDQGLEDITDLMMKKLPEKQEQPGLDSVSLNSSQEDGSSHFHVDPITGHIATVTLNPHRTTGLQPHADDM